MSTKYIQFGFQKTLYYIYNMKKLLTFIIGSAVWYGVFSFIVWEPNAFAWHWGVRLVYSLFVIGTMRSALED